jgi:SAM-dependent methyltransferase
MWCGSLERHRFAWLFLRDRTDLLDGRPKRVLHVAPEPCLAESLAPSLGPGYLTADLEDPRAMVRVDITAIDLEDASVDVVCCSHVLEHVVDDRRAMRELRRVLRPDGWALFSVPITASRTIEDPTVEDPEERLRLFGQGDHVRRYGPDVEERLREAGFDVTVVSPVDVVESEDERRVLGLPPPGAVLFYCRKA